MKSPFGSEEKNKKRKKLMIPHLAETTAKVIAVVSRFKNCYATEKQFFFFFVVGKFSDEEGMRRKQTF